MVGGTVPYLSEMLGLLVSARQELKLETQWEPAATDLQRLPLLGVWQLLWGCKGARKRRQGKCNQVHHSLGC